MTEQSPPLSVVCFANAQLPDSDYRVSFALRSRRCRVTLALPKKPDVLPSSNFEAINVGAGMSVRTAVSMFRIPLVLRRRRADVAIFFATQFATFGPVFARLVGCTPIVTITGLGRAFSGTGRRSGLSRHLYLLMFRLNARLCRAVLFQNPEDMAKLVQHLPEAQVKRCNLIGSGIEMSYFTGERPSTTGRRVLMIARLIEEKGIADFLELAESLPDLAEYVLIGPESDDQPSVLTAVMTAHDEGVIEYRGPMESSQVRAELRHTDILVIPSYSEGLPRVAMEAAASGVAVAAYNIPGCRAALGPEHPLVPLKNRRALSEQVAKLLSDPDFRARHSERARQFIIEQRSAEAYVRRLEAILL